MGMLPKQFIEIGSFLLSKGINAYLIGSSSRDFLFGKDIEDFDIAIDKPIDSIVDLFDEKMDKYAC